MGVGAGIYMYVVVVQKFTFAISSPDEFLLMMAKSSVDHHINVTDRQQRQTGQRSDSIGRMEINFPRYF